MEKIGFIGTGVMGSSMVKNLLKHGYRVNVYNRTPDKAQALEKDGAKFCTSIEECIKNVDIIITIVGMPSDVEEVYNMIFTCAKKDCIAIDMTTSSPTLAKNLYAQGKKQGIEVLDAPVSGGDVGAQKGTLSIMVGGDKATFDKVNHVLAAMGTNIVYIGPAGSGQHTKMANQIAIAGTIGAVNEALAYTKTMGLDQKTVLDAIANGAAGSWQMTYNGAKMIAKDDTPGFFIKHFIKDMKLAQDEANNNDLKLPVLDIVEKQYEELSKDGYDNLGTQALYKLFDKH